MSKPAPDRPEPGPIGGQALIEGVMMRRGKAWGAAVRTREGSISTTGHRLPEFDGWRTLPLVRGVLALGETVVLGTRATLWGATERGDESGDGYTRGGLALTVLIAVVAVLGVFGLLPAVVVKAAGIDNALLFSTVEGLIRLGILVGYLWLLSRSAAVARVFAYHGAEHMTIHAFEHGRPLVPAEIRRFDRRHPRCGTAFLLTVVLVTILAHDGRPGLEVRGPDGWLGVPAVDGTFVVNLGDMLEAMTGGRYRSTPHRVVAPADGPDRLSFPVFFDPAWDARVAPLPLDHLGPPSPAQGERWDGTPVDAWEGRYGDYLTAKVAKVFPDLGAEVFDQPQA